MSSWTDERVERLKALRSDGYSSSQIAAKLGGVSRNGVIGKLHRLGIKGGGQPTRSIARRSRSTAVEPVRTRAETAIDNRTRMRIKRTAAPPPRPGSIAETLPEDRGAPAKLLSVLDLTERTCKWPFGHPRDAGFGFCGAGKDSGQPYCGDHDAIAYRAPDPRRRLKAAQALHAYLATA